MSTETPIVIFNNQIQVFVVEGKTSFTHLTRRSFVEVTCSGFSFNISDFILPIPNSFVARKTDATQLSAKGFLHLRSFPGSAGSSAHTSISRHCRHFCSLQFFHALQALLPLASCLQRYNKEAIIAHHWLDRILPDAALILASSLFPMALRYSASASMRSATAAWLALSSRWIFAVAPLPADAQQRRPGWSAAPPQRPGQLLRCNSSVSTSAAAPWPATNLIRRRKVLRFG